MVDFETRLVLEKEGSSLEPSQTPQVSSVSKIGWRCSYRRGGGKAYVVHDALAEPNAAEHNDSSWHPFSRVRGKKAAGPRYRKAQRKGIFKNASGRNQGQPVWLKGESSAHSTASPYLAPDRESV